MSSRKTLAFLAAALPLALAQQPEQAHLALTGKPDELSLDFMAHEANCSAGYGAQLATTPDFTSADFIAAYACTDFTTSSAQLSLAVRVLLPKLVAGTTYYYVAGAEGLRNPWSQVYSFTHASGSVRAGGPVYAIVADFGFYNAESLKKLEAEAFEGRYDMLLHAGGASRRCLAGRARARRAALTLTLAEPVSLPLPHIPRPRV